MTQIATVTALSDSVKGRVEVTVTRQTACGHDCENCGGCASGKAAGLVVLAETDLSLRPGDQVEIYSDNKVLAAAALVYLGPVILFLLGYLLPGGLSDGMRGICGGLGFALGIAAAVVCDRRIKSRSGVRYRVTRKL